MERLELRLLGRFTLERDGAEVPQVGSDKAKALLALLASEPQRVWARATVAELLWPDRPPGGALGNLRHTLSSVRRALAGSTTLVTTRATLAFATGAGVWVDLVEFDELASTPPENAAAPDAWQRATELWRGEFLDGLHPDASAEWEQWKVATAERCRRKMATVLRHIANHFAQSGELDRLIDTTRHLIEIDPWDERGHRRLMEALAEGGQHVVALAHYAALVDRLDDEYRTQPSPQTAALADRIRRGRSGG